MPPTGANLDECAVTLYLRASPATPARERQRTVRARFERLADDGRVGDATVERWSRAVPLADSPPAPDHEFRAWAEETGVSLSPFFDVREEYTLATDSLGVREVLVRPVMCLTVRVGGDLRAVYPHDDGDRVLSLTDGLDALDSEATSAASVVPQRGLVQ